MIMEDAMSRTRPRGNRLAVAQPPAPAPRPAPQPLALPPTRTAGVAPKVTASTLTAGLLGLAVAAANGLQANPALISFLPPLWQWVALTLAPPLFVALAGYWAPAGDIWVDVPDEPDAGGAGDDAGDDAEDDSTGELDPLDDWGDPGDDSVAFGSGESGSGHTPGGSAGSSTVDRFSGWPYEGGSHEAGHPRID